MFFRRIKRLFRAHWTDDAGRPAPYRWIEEREDAVLFSRDSGRVLAHVCFRYGKFQGVVIVSPWRALYLLCKPFGFFLTSLLPFPRLMIDVSVHVETLGEAQQFAEELLGLRD